MFNVGDVALLERAGVFHRAEARGRGLSDRQIWKRAEAGIWVEVLPGVYRSTATPMTGELWRRAAWLWAGKDAVLSHQSAAAAWRLDGVDASSLHVTVPVERNPRSDLVSVHRSRVDPATSCRPMVFAVLASCARCSMWRPSSTKCHSKPRSKVLGVSTEPVPPHSRHASEPPIGLRKCSHGCSDSSTRANRPSPCSKCESRGSDLPQPVRQLTIRVFGKRYRLDFAWPEVRLALECDGRAFHEFQRDRTRWRQIGASGWRVLPVTWHDVTTCWPAVLAELTSALAQ